MYNELADQLERELETLNEYITTLKNNSLETLWTGDTSTYLNNELNETISSLETQRNTLVSFIATLRNVEIYKRNKEEIDSLNMTLSNLENTEENASTIYSINGQIGILQITNNTLRTSIVNSITGFQYYTSTKALVNHTE